MGRDLKLNGKPENYSDYLSEDLCLVLWKWLPSKGEYNLILLKMDTEIDEMCDEMCDECERGDCDDCQREPQINEGHL